MRKTLRRSIKYAVGGLATYCIGVIIAGIVEIELEALRKAATPIHPQMT